MGDDTWAIASGGAGPELAGLVERARTVELTPPHGSGVWTVEVGDGAGGSVACELGGRPLVVGASPDADLRVVDPAVSGRHCTLAADGGVLRVVDLGSTNGTWVGGARVPSAMLGAGATFVIGRSVVACHRGADAVDAPASTPLPGVSGASAAMRRLADDVRRVAALRAPVLLRGETGVGKDVVARALHAVGPRRARPFVPLNVGTLPRELAESELFGHERGAYTGAHAPREGAFVEAHGGTLFLDEIGEMSLELQPKLLRALECGEVRPVGGKGTRRTDARIVSATWQPLEQRLGDGSFRLDLYQRLAVFVVDIPPLRERRSDIAPIAASILHDLASEVGPRALSSGALAKLVAYAWPGNVRELRNVLYRAAVMSPGRGIACEHVAHALRATTAWTRPQLSRDQALAALERQRGNVSATARHLGVPRSTLRSWLAPARSRSALAPAVDQNAPPAASPANPGA